MGARAFTNESLYKLKFPALSEIESLSVPGYRLEGSSVEMVCRYLVDSQRLGELDIKWYLESSPSPWLVHLPHHWTLPHVVRGSGLADHVSQVQTGDLSLVHRHRDTRLSLVLMSMP